MRPVSQSYPPRHAQRSSSGVPGLDEVLDGGFIANRVYLIEGNPGAGKTTLALQFLLEGLERGERGLFISLGETAEELNANAGVKKDIQAAERAIKNAAASHQAGG